MKAKELIGAIDRGELDKRLKELYREDFARQKERYKKLIGDFCGLYGEDREASIFSVPGRSELSGNHTDHNHGKVLAGAINLDIIAVASKSDKAVVRIKSEGYREDAVSIADTREPKNENKFKSRGLIAGTCAGFVKHGYTAGGFDACTTTEVLKGSGISSSAAFEDMVGNIMNHFWNGGKISAPEIAKIAQFAENEYFGKPCGLMDQTACAVGGFVEIDFADPKEPVIEAIDFDLAGHGYALCIVNTGGNHADLNEDYASVPSEMKSVAAYFGKSVLRDVTAEDIIANAPVLRRTVGDRAILRALHFEGENTRVEKQAAALRAGDIDTFLRGVLESGDSSYKYLQNVYTVKNIKEQGLSLALCITEMLMKGKKGAWRVHGGGFAGTVQAFVPLDFADGYAKVMDSVFGEGACRKLFIRAQGAIRVI